MNNPNSMTKVYQGGHWQDLHKMLEISFGDKILYVGDHMYSDILRWVMKFLRYFSKVQS